MIHFLDVADNDGDGDNTEMCFHNPFSRLKYCVTNYIFENALMLPVIYLHMWPIHL